ncbi:HupE/UreJ family protein [Cohnella kolymensis]|uniref:HupE/UreJ family protein n=1 Tax=Cohnella kolymensis TaxID=1590652 RepID=UPI00069714E1|nr:HupE/UreJ family protein [Cohnella kolymensis]
MDWVPAASAHFATVGHSDIEIRDNTVSYTLELDAQEVGQWLDLNSGERVFVIEPKAAQEKATENGDAGFSELESLVSRFLSVTNNNVPAKPELLDFSPMKRGDNEFIRMLIDFRFDQPIEDYKIQYSFFFDDMDPKHQNFAQLRVNDKVSDYVFQQSNRTTSGSALQADKHVQGSDWSGTLRTYTLMGMKHIWEGYDHLLFLIGLVILKQRKSDYLKMLTAFTLGHSITLALSALDIFTISLKIIEPLIALSIVYIAVENIWLKRPYRRWAIALGFGLVHGFGFADILRGALGGDFVLSLLSFNLGVEIGQVAVLALLLPLLWLLGKARSYPAWMRGLSGAIGCLGLFWFIERIV